jgi:hypothetical protein
MLLQAVHDFEHRGVSNDFLVKVADPLAIRYNDRSPQENHHAAASFTLLLADEFNFIKGLSLKHRVSALGSPSSVSPALLKSPTEINSHVLNVASTPRDPQAAHPFAVAALSASWCTAAVMVQPAAAGSIMPIHVLLLSDKCVACVFVCPTGAAAQADH